MTGKFRGRSAPSPRPCGERAGGRGSIRAFGLAESPPHPALRADLSPQAGRGKPEPPRKMSLREPPRLDRRDLQRDVAAVDCGLRKRAAREPQARLRTARALSVQAPRRRV